MADDTSVPGLGPVTYSPKQSLTPEREMAEAALRAIPGVHGVGEGRDSVGNPAWIAYVQDASVATLLPKRVANRDVVPMTTGTITTRPAR
jgi:hypothetical protein